MKKKLVLVIFYLFVMESLAQAAVYYVDNSGSSSCSNSSSYGTEAKPWCTISYALGLMRGGDDLYIKSGTYHEASMTITGPSGSASKNTTIQAYPGNTIIIRGDGYNSGRVKISGVNHMVFSGLNVTYYNEGIYVENSNYITVQNCNIYDIGQEAFAIKANSSYGTIKNNTIHDTGKWTNQWGEGIYVGTRQDNTPNDNTNNITITNNTIYNTTDECVELKPGTHDCIVDGNVMYSCANNSEFNTHPDWGSIEVNEAVNAPEHWDANPGHIIRNNIIHDTKTGIQLGTGSIAYNNVIYNINSPFYGIYTRNTAQDSYTRVIYQNTIDMPSSRAVYVGGVTSDVKNNIGPATTNNMTTSSSFYANQSTGNYHLVAGAAPVNAGLNLTATVPTDKDGVSRSAYGAPDLGAYEYRTTTVPSPPLNLRVP